MQNLINLLRLIIWKYFPVFRPKYFVVEGKLFITLSTKLIIKGKGVITVYGNADFSNSTIVLIDSELICKSITCINTKILATDSTLNLAASADFKNANLELNQTKILAGNHFRIHHYHLNFKNSDIKVGNYLFCDGDTRHHTLFELLNAAFYVKENVRIQAGILVNNGKLTIGSNSFINRGTKINCQLSISIGNYVMISYDCYIFDNNSHSTNYLNRQKEIDQGFPNGTLQNVSLNISHKAIHIEDDVWVGVRCMIMKGVTIHSKAIVAANTVVTKDVLENHLVYGNPNQYKLIQN